MLGPRRRWEARPRGPRSARRSRRKGTALRVFRADRLTRGLVLSPTLAPGPHRTEGGIWPMQKHSDLPTETLTSCGRVGPTMTLRSIRPGRQVLMDDQPATVGLPTEHDGLYLMDPFFARVG